MTAIQILRRQRKSWVSNDFAKAFPGMIKKIHGKNQMNTNCTTYHIRIDSVLKILYPLSNGWLNRTRLYTKSQIRMRQAFCDMVSYCGTMGFIENIQGGFQLTGKGESFLKMFQ